MTRPRLEEMEARLAPAALIAPTPNLATAVAGATSGTNVFNQSANNTTRADYSSPVVVADPTNSLQQVMVTQSSRIADGLLGVTLQYTTDGGQNWSSPGLIAPLPDHSSTDFPVKVFANTSQASVTFGRDGIFYVTYIQHSALATYSAGAVVVESYSFSGSPSARNIVSPQNRTLNGGSATQQVLYRWSNSQDAAYNPVIAVDNNLGSYTEPGGATFIDTLVRVGGAPKAVYVAYNTLGAEPTGDDSASAPAQGRFFNPNAVFASVSTDAGANFSAPIAVNGSGRDVTALPAGGLVGQFAGYRALSEALNTGGGAPVVAFSPGSSAAPGRAVIGWAGLLSDDANKGKNSSINYDVTAPDGGLAANSAGFVRSFARSDSAPIFDAFEAVSPATFDTPVQSNYLVTIDTSGFTVDDKSSFVSNLTVTAVVEHKDLSTISLQLISPDGKTTVNLFSNRVAGDGATRANGGVFNQPPGLAASPGFANPASLQGLGLGRTAGTKGNLSVGTTFDDYAARRITDPKNAFPYLGSFKGENWSAANGSLSVFAGKTVGDLAGAWTLRVTDFRADRYAATDTNRANSSFEYFAINVTAGANQSLAPGMSTDGRLGAVVVPILGATPFPAITPTPDGTVAGIGPGLSIAFDTSLQPYNNGGGPFTTQTGQLFFAYNFNAATDPANDPPQYDVRLTRAVLSPTPGSAALFVAGTTRVNDDAAADNFSEGNRTQFQPTVAVDPATGTVAVMWYDGRYDAGKTRVATYLATSIDGGLTFSQSDDGGATPGAQIYLNVPRTATNAIKYGATGGDLAQSLVSLEPTPTLITNLTNKGAAEPNGNLLGLGQRQSLFATAPGQFNSYWTGNQNLPSEGFTDQSKRNFIGNSVFRSVVTGAAGPRVVAGGMGPVASNTLTSFTITFDRPVDVATLTAADIAVQFRSPTNAVRNLVAGTDFGTPIPLNAGGVGNRAATRFSVPFLIPQTAVGTYSYTAGPAVNDLIRGTSTFVPNGFKTQTNYSPLPTSYPAAAVAYTNPPSVTNYAVTVTDPTGLLVYSPRVRLALVPNAAQIGWLQDLFIELIAPNGVTSVVLYNGPGRNSTTNSTMDAEFRDGTDGGVPLPSSGNVTGQVQAETALTAFRGLPVAGTWTVRVTNVYTADGSVSAVGLSFVTGVLVPTFGNAMDQDANGVAGVANLDAFAAPRALGRRSNPTAFPFPNNYDGLTSPLIITGPRYVSPAAERLTLNDAVRSVTVTFDRDMNQGSFEADGRDILRILGPTGTIFDQNEWNSRFPGKAYPVSVVPIDARNFQVNFKSLDGTVEIPQVVSGNYNIEFGANILSTLGDALDNNRNAGVAVLRGGDPTNGAIAVNSYNSVPGAVTIPSGRTVSMDLIVNDSFSIVETLAKFITVRIDVTHPNVPDLVGDLVAPDGSRVRLFTNVGTSAVLKTNFSNTIFSDGGTTAIQQGAAPFSAGPYTPQFPLSILRGRPSTLLDPVTGLPIPWRLVITNTGTTAGTINNFTLALPFAVPVSGLGEAVDDRFTVPFRIFTQDATNKLTQNAFTPVGPAPENGPGPGDNASRITGLALDPSDASGNTFYAGGSSGGVFKTTNFLTRDARGPNWIPLTDFGPTTSLNMGSIAVFGRNNDPNQSIVFALTGEGDIGTGGVGVLRSLDGGKTWKVLDSLNNLDGAGNIAAIDASSRDHRFVGSTGFKIIVDPTATPTGDVIVYFAVSGRNGGVYRSTDTGRTFQLVRAGNATDVFLAAGLRSTGVGSSGALSFLYASFAGEGVFTTPQATTSTSMTITSGTDGTPLVRNIDDGGSKSKALTVNPSPGPNGAKGRIQISGPAATGDVLQDTFYAGWLYAIISTPAGGTTLGGEFFGGGNLDGLYLTKDFGRNWVKVKIPVFFPDANLRPGTAYPTNNETRADHNIFGQPGLPGQGNFDIDIVVDPLNPEVVYVGGDGVAAPSPAGGLIRVDVSAIADSQAFVTFDNSSASQVGPLTGTNGGVTFVRNDKATPIILGFGAANPNVTNLSRNPDAPFLSNATVLVTKAVSFTNTGENAKYSGFLGFTSTADTHRILAFRDQLTGKTRVVVSGDQQVASGVDDGAGNLVSAVGSAVSVGNSRNGNLQIFQAYSGAAQPSQLAVDLAQAFLYGMGQDNGFPVSAPDVLTTGNLTFTGVPGDGAGVATDQTGSGTAYQYRWPCCQNDGAVGTDFFRVIAPPGPGFASGVSRTNGLLQAGDDPGANKGQWPLIADIGYFSVNPIDPAGILISSAAGRVFRTTNAGRNWFPVGEPGQLDGSYGHATAFGSPDPNAIPGELNNFLYVGTDAGNIFTTRTGTAPWTRISAGLDGNPVKMIVPNPQRGSRGVYAVTTGGVFFLADSSAPNATWVNVSGATVAGVDPAVSGRIQDLRKPIFGDANNATTNATPNSRMPFNLQGLTSLVADWRYAIPTNPAVPGSPTFPILYAAGQGGVFRSLNGGKSWEVFPDAQPLVDPATGAALKDPITGQPLSTPRGGLLPNVDIRDLDLSLGNIDPLTGFPKQSSGGFNLLYVSTYGRGSFAIRLEDPASVAQYNVLAQSGPRVVGLAASSKASFRVRFDAPVVATTFDPTDVVLTNAAGQRITVTAVTPVTNLVNGADQRNLFNVSFTPLAPSDSYTVTVGEKIADFAGFGMNQNRDKVNGDSTLSKVTGNTIAGVFTPASVDSYTGTFVTVNAPTQLGNLFVDQPYVARAGDPVTVAVTATAPDGNPLTTYTGTVRFASSDSKISTANGGLPGDYTFSTFDGGTKVFAVAYRTATFVAPAAPVPPAPPLTDAQVLAASGTQSLTVTDVNPVAAARIGGAVEKIVVRGGAAKAFDVFGVPSPTVAGSKNDVTVTARDAFGNLADGFVGGVTFTTTDAQSTPANGGLPNGFAFLAADFGSKVIAQQVSLKTVGVQSVTATDVLTGAITGTQSGIVVVPAAPALFTVTGHASPVVAGSKNDFTVTAYDPFGNVATSYTGTVRFTSSDAQAGLPADYTFTSGVGAGFDNGVHLFAAGSQLKTAGSQSLTATDSLTATVTGTQSNIVVVAAPAKSFDVFGVTTPIVAGVASDVSLTARDAYNNVATGFLGNVTFSSSDKQVAPGVGLPADYTFTAANSGKATLVKLLSLRTVGTQSVTVTDVATGLATGKQTGIVVTPAAASKFDVFGIANPFEAGKLGNVSLTARDPFNNIDTNFVGDVSFFSSDPQVLVGDGLPINLTFFPADKGQTGVTDQVSLRTAGLQSVSAKDTKSGLLVGTQGSILVTPTAANSLKLGGHRTPVVAGTTSDLTATAFDRFGNVATGYKGTLAFSSSDAQAGLPANYTFVPADGGAHTFVAGSQLKTAGKQSVTATDTVTKTISATQSNIVVVAAPASQFTVSGHPTPVVAGSKNGFTVLATDPFGNRATTYSGTVRFTSSDPLVAAGNGLPNQYTFAAAEGGTHTFIGAVQLKTAGLQTLAATDLADGFTGLQRDIQVTSAAATTLNLVGFPSPITAGAAGTFGVVARDQYGNQATTYKGVLRFTSSDPLVGPGKGLPNDYAFTAADNGVRVFDAGATLKTAGLQSLVATDAASSAIAGSQTGILVNPDVAASLALTGYPAAVAAGTSNPFTVTARDRFGNLATGYSGTVIFDSSDRQVGANKGLPNLYTFTPDDKGQRSFPATLKTAGTQSISTTDVVSPSLKASQTGIVVTAGALSRVTVGGYPTPVVAGLDTGLTVSAADAFGNPVSNFAGTVQFTTTDKQGTVPAAYTFVTADKGRKTFASGFVLRTAGLQAVTAAVTGNPALAGTQADIAVVAATAATFKFSDFPNPLTALTPATFTVTAFDAFGNFAGGFKGDVALTSSDGKAILSSPVTLANGVGKGTVTFRTAGTQSVTVADPNDPTLSGTSGGLAVGTPAPGVVDPGSLNPLSLSDLTAVGTDAGVPSLVRVLNPDGTVRNEFAPYDPSFVGGVRVALQRTPFGPRVVTAPGSGLTSDVRVYDLATGKVTRSILPFEASFVGGVFVTTGDLNNDGYDDIVLSPDNGGGPRVRIIDGKTFGTLSDFFGIDDKAFRGGVRSTLTDINGDGVNDLVVAAGFGGGPRVAIYDGRSVLSGSTSPVKLAADFFAFEPELRNGAYVAGGDVNGDGYGDLAFGAGPGGGPRVRVVNGKQILLASPFPNVDLIPQAQIGNYFSGDAAATGGVRVTMKRLSNADGAGAAVVTGSGTGNGTTVRAYLAEQILGNVVPNTQWEYEDLPGLNTGVFVG